MKIANVDLVPRKEVPELADCHVQNCPCHVKIANVDLVPRKEVTELPGCHLNIAGEHSATSRSTSVGQVPRAELPVAT